MMNKLLSYIESWFKLFPKNRNKILSEKKLYFCFNRTETINKPTHICIYRYIPMHEFIFDPVCKLWLNLILERRFFGLEVIFKNENEVLSGCLSKILILELIL
jgi:hypothetical protein